MRTQFLKRWWVAVAALAGASALALSVASVAQAEFTSPYTTQCSGGEASLIGGQPGQSALDNLAFEFEERDVASPLSCAEEGPSVEVFTRTGPAALEALGSTGGVRNSAYTFASTEEPPTLAQWLSIDLGNEPGVNSGLIRQIPVASTAVVPIVHFPTGCSIPAEEATSDGRFVVPNAMLEKAYAGVVATWGELLPGMEGSCASLPIERVVPAGTEGTTFVFKQWLATVDPSRGWNSLGSATWPNDSGATATVRAEADSGVANLVRRTSGSIGFASLPSARSENFGHFSPENPHYKPGLFWLSVQNGAGEEVEPTRDPESGADNALGANCDDPTFNYVPSGYDTTVTPIWRAVSAAGSKTGWPICTLVYALAWDDSSTVYGNTEAEQSKQRTVKDYLAYVLGEAGQEVVEERDYSKLPSAILADAQEGQSRVGWDKAGDFRDSESDMKAQISVAAKHSQP